LLEIDGAEHEIALTDKDVNQLTDKLVKVRYPHGVIEKQRPVSALETIARERRDARQ
jgi:hypothetical protein